MAPKAKPDPKAKAPPKKGPKEPAKPILFGILTLKQTIIYAVCIAIVLFSILTIIVMTIVYFTLNELGGPMDYPLKRLRSNLAYTFNTTEYDSAGTMTLADAAINLPANVTKADQDFEAKKQVYQGLFQKTAKSSSVPWKLHGESLYYFAKEQKTWYDAESFCISRDAHLASILNDEEQNFITSQIQQASWIGLMDEKRDGAWGWTDGSGLQKEYWSHGEPSSTERSRDLDHDCTLIVPRATNQNWNVGDCYKRYGWVCKEKLDFE